MLLIMRENRCAELIGGDFFMYLSTLAFGENIGQL